MTEERSERPIWLGRDLRQWDHVRLHVALMKDDRLGANEIAVYAGLAIHAELHSGICWPALDTIAEYAKIHPRTARRSVQVLSDAKWIKIIERKGKASEYQLLPPPADYPHPGQKVQGSLSTPRTESAGDPGQKVQGTPDTDRDEQEPRTITKNNGLSTGSCECENDLGERTGWVERDAAVERCGCDYRVATPHDPLVPHD